MEDTTKVCPISGGTELATASKSGSVTVLGGLVPKPVKFGSSKSISPVAITIPLSSPKDVFIALKKPICMLSP